MEVPIFSRSRIRAFQEWARKAAVHLEPLDAARIDVERLAVLDPLLAGKRIVYLGEPDHWIHEKYAYRTLLLRYLHARGLRWVGEELGWADGLRVDRYLESGDASWLERVATYGYRGGHRTDRTDTATGLLRDSWDAYPVEAFRAEQVRLAGQLRALGAGRPASERIRFFGFDVDTLPGIGYEDIEELLGPHRTHPVVAPLRTTLARVDGETVEEEITRLSRARADIDAQADRLGRVLGADRLELLGRGVQGLLDGLAFVRVAYPATAPAPLGEAMAARERVMHRHVEEVLSRLGEGEKLVLMSHILHLAKEADALRTRGAIAGPGGSRVPCLGTVLCRHRPDEVFSIWMLCDRGTTAQPYRALGSEVAHVPGSLNAILAEVGNAFFLPTASHDPRAALLTRKTNVVSVFGVTTRTAIAEQADAIFFVRDVGPLRA